jgi:hypothetical protein
VHLIARCSHYFCRHEPTNSLGPRQIHVDRYKFDIYNQISDPFLKSLVTLDSLSTRFHACERKNRCDQVEYGTVGVVYVNPVTLSKVKWNNYFLKIRDSLKRGEHVSNLVFFNFFNAISHLVKLCRSLTRRFAHCHVIQHSQNCGLL